MKEIMEKMFTAVESVTPECEVEFSELTFDQVLQIVEKYKNSHGFKLFGIRVYPWSENRLLLPQRPYSNFLEGADGYLYKNVLVDCLDRSHTWYLFEGKPYNIYNLAVYAIPPQAQLCLVPMWFTEIR